MNSKKIIESVAKTAASMGVNKLEAKAGKVVKSAGKDIDTTVARAQKEFDKVRKQAEATMKKAESYIKKNPEKSAAIAAGVGAALATAAAIFLSGDNKSKRKKK